ncbi:MAG: hypothetical protein GTN69_07525, partial [Armatimonadetes bacterium]|nr:hypothetical protein [Armatimonadota bacterium]NIO75720.1 hypothetical protein [Armatimonadota bacterium]NIO96945.1 hypothetical protein [Armatimonadota bacterium]
LENALREGRLDEQQREGVEKLLYYMIFEYLVPFDRETLSVTPEAANMLIERGAFRGLAEEA